MRYQIPFDLDSPERTEYHRSLLMSKPFLKKLFTEWYQSFKLRIADLPKGKMVEIGSGGGFFKEIVPEVVTSDILPLSSTDLTFSALEMPFQENSLSGLFMIDTFHHIPNAAAFLVEANRALMPGGKIIMIEPANSRWGRFIYQRFHHEPFDPDGNWSFPTSGPMSGANGALPWIVFERDRALFEKRFPNLHIKSIFYHTPLRYLLSGGFSYPSLVPSFTYGLFTRLDRSLATASKQFSMFMDIVVEKK